MAMNWVPGESRPARPVLLGVVVAGFALTSAVLASTTHAHHPRPAAARAQAHHCPIHIELTLGTREVTTPDCQRPGFTAALALTGAVGDASASLAANASAHRPRVKQSAARDRKRAES